MDDNIHNLRDALEWLDRRIREEAELDGEMSNEHAIQLGFITNILEKFPLRQCDVGTSAEQNNRYEHYCFTHRTMERCCQDCPIKDEPCCELAWGQMPCEAEEGDAK